jgi:hypothetical protein
MRSANHKLTWETPDELAAGNEEAVAQPVESAQINNIWR